MVAASFHHQGAIYEPPTPQNAAMVLLDHQTGIMLGVGDFTAAEFKNNILALAKIAKVYDLPTVLTTSYEDGPNGPLMPELIEMFPERKVIKRPGQINAWDDPYFVAAIEATRRKTLIMAGVTTDVCLTFPAISAVAAGYTVYAVIDASGTWNQSVQQAAMLRMTQAGVIVTNWVSVAAELQKDWRLPTGRDMAKLFHEHLTFYGMLMNNVSAKAKE